MEGVLHLDLVWGREHVSLFFGRRKENQTMTLTLHVATNVASWSAPTLQSLDATLQDAGSVALELPWHSFGLEDDGEHFTEAGAMAFCAALVTHTLLAMREAKTDRRKLVIVSDSTIDHNDRDDDGTWHGRASRRLRDGFARHGVDATVDAVGGTGFLAGARDGQHFFARLARRVLRRSTVDDACVLLIGGWNDVRTGSAGECTRLCAAAQACVRRGLRG